jgi:hypothetical protein
MSLQLDYKSIKNYKEVTRHQNPDGSWSCAASTYTIGLCTMALGLGSISEKNIAEWHFRLAYLEHTGDSVFQIPVAVAMGAIRQHIGLRANVVEEGRKEWLNRVDCARVHEVSYQLERQADGHPYEQWFAVAGINPDSGDVELREVIAADYIGARRAFAEAVGAIVDGAQTMTLDELIIGCLACGRVRPAGAI